VASGSAAIRKHPPNQRASVIVKLAVLSQQRPFSLSSRKNQSSSLWYGEIRIVEIQEIKNRDERTLLTSN